MRTVLVVLALFMMTTKAYTHGWYTKKSDPVMGGCCSGNDCREWYIQPGQLTGEGEGFRVKMTREQILYANPESDLPYIDQYFPLSRIIPSEDGNWHACPKFAGDPKDGLRCLMMPPNG